MVKEWDPLPLNTVLTYTSTKESLFKNGNSDCRICQCFLKEISRYMSGKIEHYYTHMPEKLFYNVCRANEN